MSEILALTTTPARRLDSFKYDHRMYFEGVFYADGSPVLDEKASAVAEMAYVGRCFHRMMAKGRPHFCRVIEWPTEIPTSRQQWRALLRRLAKLERRAGQKCHKNDLTLTEAPSTIAA